MSRRSFLEFLKAVRDDPAMRARYSQRNLSQLIFHAKNDGFEFTEADGADVIGALEASIILQKDGDSFDGSARLWRRMWGSSFLEYLMDHVVARHSDEEMTALLETGEAQSQ